ncbi:MAG: aminotransferase class I/II-fold pyridoxal phosphate-dependent enzyme, partial [Deltaproteobacteria bacterium]|nr:aminotransferase class I/II-fold pyridoxal phosphate-dependent enzyme [Deltaproteobacteria bacterium]
EDPSINALQEKAATILGVEEALYVPSGTMANQLAIRILTRPGDEILIEAGAHPYNNESGGAAVISSVQFKTLPGERGILNPEQIETSIRPDNIHHTPTRAVFIENTSNSGGGTVYPMETIAAISEVAKAHNLLMHMDGARLFNACVASGHKPADFARYFDTISFCLSKGLGAPVGSIIAGTKPLIKEALRWRKVLGGGMRQAGILAAAGIYALDNNVDRLAEDHENARILAIGLAELDGIEITPRHIETNLVIFRTDLPQMTAPELAARLKEYDVLVLAFGPDSIRAVTHLDVDRAGIEKTLKAFRAIL